ncbi:MAG: asparagine synthase (glutamine-hydrolyzing) [Elusimicrobiota bacterium]
MCGIVGLLRPGGLSEPAAVENTVREAAAAIAYRGPDAAGVKLLPEDGLAFGHRRLSILDLDPRANQPMASADGRIIITYNGEVYNFRELRTQLAQEGAGFRTESDTEVLLAGYRLWGLDKLLERAVGMFAFALYDAQRKTLFLARDRAGQKPLFYAHTPAGELVFASEMRALLRLYPQARALDPAGLDAYLQVKYTPSPQTLFKGVRKLPPGHLLELESGKPPRERRYWSPFKKGGKIITDAEGWLAGIEAALTTSVKRRLVSDVPVCLFLSGGIDSSLIADALGRCDAPRMKAYSIGYGDLPAYNEFEYSRLIAKKYPIDYEEVVLESGEARDLLRDDALILDEPISDWVWVPLYQLSRRAHADGFKVVLLGEGADELFFGYDVMLKGMRQVHRFESAIWRLAATVGAAALGPVYRRTRKGHRRYDLMRRVAAGEPIYMGSSIGFGRSQRRQVAGARLIEEGRADAGSAALQALHESYNAQSYDPLDTVNRICYIEFLTKMTEVLLQRVDRVSMLHSLEARSPFLDHELVELAFALHGGLKIRGGLKGLFKEFARRRLPAAVVDRKKMGFSFPFKEWLRGDLGGLVEETFADASLFKDGWVNGDFARALLREHRSGLFDHAPRTWTLFSLCRWYERWIKTRS